MKTQTTITPNHRPDFISWVAMIYPNDSGKQTKALEAAGIHECQICGNPGAIVPESMDIIWTHPGRCHNVFVKNEIKAMDYQREN